MILPVDNVETMEMFERAEEFCGIKAATILVKFALPLEMIEQFSSVN